MSRPFLKYVLAGLAALLLYFLPNLILGENSVIQVHDFLDSNVAHIQRMKLDGTLFAPEGTLPILGGVDVRLAGSPWNLRVLLYALLPTFWAIIANLVLIKLTAFLGLFFLLTGYVLKEGKRALPAAFAAALLFALVPFYPDYGISSAGVPALLLGFASLQEGRRVLPGLLLIACYAFFSSLVLSGIFVCVLVAALLLVSWVHCRKFPWWPFAGLLLLTVLYVGLNWQLFASFLFPADAGELSHRVEFAQPSFWLSLATSLGAFLISQYHAGTCLAILPLVLFFVLCRRKYAGLRQLVLLFLALMLLGVLANAVLVRIGFQADRFYFLYPAFAYLLLGVVLFELPSRKGRAFLAAGMLLFSLAFDAHLRDNIAGHLGYPDTPTYAQYYDTALIERIRADVPLEKVACVGMHPAVAEYNGLETVDGYYPSYPLSYKHRFQQVIQGELDKSETLKAYFCDWGSRCYLFSAELGTKYLWGKDSGKSIAELSIDTDALRELGCGHILSAVPIENAAALGLEEAGCWTDDGSYWSIIVYKL